MAALYAAVRADPAAGRVEPNNARRIVRALEMLELTGHYTASLPDPRYALADVVQVGLALDREVLDARIAERVDMMWAQGLVEEVRRLEAAGLRRGRTASRAIGYRQVLEHLAGEIDEAAAAEHDPRTRRFARKQLGWFRRDDASAGSTRPDRSRTCRRVARRLAAAVRLVRVE